MEGVAGVLYNSANFVYYYYGAGVSEYTYVVVSMIVHVRPIHLQHKLSYT